MGVYLELYSMVTFMLPCILFLVIGAKRKEFSNKRIYILCGILFSFYCFIAIVEIAGIGTLWDLFGYGRLESNINIIPFNSEGFLTYVLNIIMFMPLGFLLPFIWSNYRRIKKVALTGLGMSLLIEIMQLFSLRATDIDDLAMNTIGTVLGYLCWMLVYRFLGHSKKGFCGITKNDGTILILFGSFSTFLFYNWRMLY